MAELSERQIKDLRVLLHFVETYCRARHGECGEKRPPASIPPEFTRRGKEPCLCAECADLFTHAVEKRRKCPLDPKPSCKKCQIHCYGKGYRAKVREIMAFSGRRLILRGRLDLLWHYFF